MVTRAAFRLWHHCADCFLRDKRQRETVQVHSCVLQGDDDGLPVFVGCGIRIVFLVLYHIVPGKRI